MRKMKQAGAILITTVLVFCLAACGGKEKESGSEEKENTQAAETETVIPEITPEPETTESEPETEAAMESDEEPGTETIVTTETEEFVPVAGLSENYADLEKRCFAYNGQVFTLGESTLQDLIDGGLPFEDNALNNTGNNVNSNYETDRYTVRINDFVSLQFSFINITETNITEAECLLSMVRWSSIYVPQPDYEDSLNQEIISQISDAANSVCFSFPLTLTKDQLLKNNGNATEISEDGNYVHYRVDSEIYMGDSGYTFGFNKKTDQLEHCTISWLP